MDLPLDLQRELDKFQLWDLYHSLPPELRTLVGYYLREHLISFEAPLDPAAPQFAAGIPVTIRLGEFTIQDTTTIPGLHYFVYGGFLELGDTAIYPPGSGPMPINEMEIYNVRTGKSLRFPDFVYRILERKIEAYIRDRGVPRIGYLTDT